MSDKKNTTHIATINTPKPPTTLQSIELILGGEPLRKVTNYYSGNTEEARKFITAAVQYLRKNPKLLKCDKTSIVTALIQSAQFRFMPSGISGEGYVIPYGVEAKFQIGYQGWVTLLYRTNKIVGITANVIYKNDIFEYQEGLEAHLKHIPAMFGKEKGEPIGVYTIVQMSGGSKTFKVMDKEAVMRIKNLSKAKDKDDSPWNSKKDPELWMWKKTCLIQHSKLLPKTEEIQKAMEIDMDGEGLNKKLDPTGPATEKPSHRPSNIIDIHTENISDSEDPSMVDDDGFIPPENPDED